MTVRIETLAETASTNAELLDRVRAGEAIPEGFWLRAVMQTGGKGRLGRDWKSPAGNLYCSTAVHLGAGDPPAQSLAFVAGLAVHDALIAATGRKWADSDERRWLKWPNDAMIGGAKIAGILLERSGDAVVAGIGLNVAHAPDLPDRVTTSLHRALGAMAVDAEGALSMLADAFARRLTGWRTGGLAQTLAAWEERAHPPGAKMTVSGTSQSPALAGTFAGLEPDGALRLALSDGSMRVVHAGDVTIA